MLPTVVFVLGAYGFYALYAVGTQRQERRLRERWRPRRLWLVRAAGWLGLGLVLSVLVYLSPHSADDRAKMAAVLGLAGQESQGVSGGGVPLPPLALKLPPPGQQPAYALLHPETPAVNPAPPGKPKRARAGPRGKIHKGLFPAPVKKPRLAAQTGKKGKDKGVARSRSKKSQPTQAGARRSAG